MTTSYSWNFIFLAGWTKIKYQLSACIQMWRDIPISHCWEESHWQPDLFGLKPLIWDHFGWGMLKLVVTSLTWRVFCVAHTNWVTRSPWQAAYKVVWPFGHDGTAITTGASSTVKQRTNYRVVVPMFQVPFCRNNGFESHPVVKPRNCRFESCSKSCSETV